MEFLDESKSHELAEGYGAPRSPEDELMFLRGECVLGRGPENRARARTGPAPFAGSENETDIIAGEAWLCWYRMEAVRDSARPRFAPAQDHFEL